MSKQQRDLATALTEAAVNINGPHSLDETLQAIVQATQSSVPGFDHVGVSLLHHGGRVETRAATGQLVWDLDILQYELREGPCVDALFEAGEVVVEGLRQEQRWPRYVPAAVEAGVRAQMGIRLFSEEEVLAVMNLYSTLADTIHPDAQHAAELFAVHAALALGRTRRESQLGEALRARKVIGQALGLVMERYQISEERAFRFLVRASSTSNTKLRVVAQQVVDESQVKFSAAQDERADVLS